MVVEYSISANIEEEMQFCLEESLDETLIKLSVEMFTEYYELRFITLIQIGFPNICRIVSHFKALYYYRKCEYMKLLTMCDSIISQEIFTLEEEIQVRDVFCVSVMFASQTLFKNYVTCLAGLIELFRPVFGEGTVNGPLSPHNLNGSQNRLWLARVSCLFLVYFLRFQSLHQLHYPKRDILCAFDDLKHARAGLLFEDILLLFVGMTLKRRQRWIIELNIELLNAKKLMFEK